MTTTKLPDALWPAYNWTAAAGEIGSLRSLAGDDLRAYARDSAENAREHGVFDVSESDLRDLASWLRDA